MNASSRVYELGSKLNCPEDDSWSETSSDSCSTYSAQPNQGQQAPLRAHAVPGAALTSGCSRTRGFSDSDTDEELLRAARERTRKFLYPYGDPTEVRPNSVNALPVAAPLAMDASVPLSPRCGSSTASSSCSECSKHEEGGIEGNRDRCTPCLPASGPLEDPASGRSAALTPASSQNSLSLDRASVASCSRSRSRQMDGALSTVTTALLDSSPSGSRFRSFEQMQGDQMMFLYDEWLQRDDGTVFVAEEQKRAAYTRAAEHFRATTTARAWARADPSCEIGSSPAGHRPASAPAGHPADATATVCSSSLFDLSRSLRRSAGVPLFPEDLVQLHALERGAARSAWGPQRVPGNRFNGDGTDPLVGPDTVVDVAARFERHLRILERIVLSPDFTDFVYTFLRDHQSGFAKRHLDHRSGAYHHNDYLLFEKFSNLVGGHILQALRSKVSDLDEEEFFSLLLKAPVQDSMLHDEEEADERLRLPQLPEVCFAVWEIMLAVMQFESFVDVMQSVTLEECGAVDGDVGVGGARAVVGMLRRTAPFAESARVEQPPSDSRTCTFEELAQLHEPKRLPPPAAQGTVADRRESNCASREQPVPPRHPRPAQRAVLPPVRAGLPPPSVGVGTPTLLGATATSKPRVAKEGRAPAGLMKRPTPLPTGGTALARKLQKPTPRGASEARRDRGSGSGAVGCDATSRSKNRSFVSATKACGKNGAEPLPKANVAGARGARPSVESHASGRIVDGTATASIELRASQRIRVPSEYLGYNTTPPPAV